MQEDVIIIRGNVLFPQIAYWVYSLLLELRWGRETSDVETFGL